MFVNYQIKGSIIIYSRRVLTQNLIRKCLGYSINKLIFSLVEHLLKGLYHFEFIVKVVNHTNRQILVSKLVKRNNMIL